MKKKNDGSIKEYYKKNKIGLDQYFKLIDLTMKYKKASGMGLIGILLVSLYFMMSHLYPLMLIIFITIPLVVIIKRKDLREEWNWFEFICMTLFCTVNGYGWMDDLMFYIKQYVENPEIIPIWGYNPWNISWLEPWAGAVLEDVVFYPATSFDMYFGYIFVKRMALKDFKYRLQINAVLFLVNWTVVYFFWSHTGYFSETTIWLFSIITVPLWVCVFPYIHVKKMVLILIFGLVFGCGMNFIGVELGMLLGMDWAIGWWYKWEITADGVVKQIHSPAYISYEDHPAYWLMRSPASVPILLSWTGAIFYYMMLEAWRFLKYKYLNTEEQVNKYLYGGNN